MRIVAAIAILLAGCAGAVGSGPRAEYLGTFIWEPIGPGFGEFSGLDMQDGEEFVTVSDIGRIAAGRFRRNAGGRIAGVELETGLLMLRDSDGEVLRGPMRDAESVAVASDGRIFVAFEQVHRVWVYDRIDGPARALPQHPDFRRFRRNQGIEAMAVTQDGILLAVPELPPAGMNDHPVYRYRNGVWDVPFRLSRDWAFWPVGANIGPDGKFYLLERDYLPVLGFRSRVRRFALAKGDRLDGETLFTSDRGRHGNLEGLAVWRDAGGAIRLTMISDNNLWQGVPTEIVEYRLRD